MYIPLIIYIPNVHFLISGAICKYSWNLTFFVKKKLVPWDDLIILKTGIKSSGTFSLNPCWERWLEIDTLKIIRKTVVFICASALSRKEKWNRSILAESNIYCKYIILTIWKEADLPLLTTTSIKNVTESTRRRATPLLPTWIYSCRSRVTVSCELPFTTNVTISTSISQTFRSWVAIFHLRQPMVFLSHSSYGMPGLAPLMNVLF